MALRSGIPAAGLLALFALHPALAEDTALPASPPDAPLIAGPPLPAGAEDWSGFYFGARLATPHGTNTWQVHNLGLELEPGSWKGSAVMMTFGRDWQSGRLTYGAQLSLGSGEVAASPTSAAFFSCVNCQTTVNDLVALRGSVGLAAGKSHFFATGGLARANVKATNVGGAVVINDDTLTGWTLGVGVERPIGDGLSLVASYDRVNLGALDLSSYVPDTDSDIGFGLMQVGMNLRW